MAAVETIEQLAKQMPPLISQEAEKGICLIQFAPPNNWRYT